MLANPLIDRLQAQHLFLALLSLGVLEGLVLGVAQWSVIHRYIKHAGWWILLTIAGALVAWLLGLRMSVLLALTVATQPDHQASTFLLTGIGLLGAWVGLILGLMQALVLQLATARAIVWVLANACAWAVGLMIAFIGTGQIAANGWNLETILTGATTGSVMGGAIGAITGAVLVWLLRPMRQT
jgi:hypothetical protein